MKLKIITGFRNDQFYSIDSEEAHKAYYLFMNPDARAIFSNGVAIIGKNIQGIEPDYHATMGWNGSHKMDSEDWNQIRGEGIDRKLRYVMEKAKDLAYKIDNNQNYMSLPLSEIETKLLS